MQAMFDLTYIKPTVVDKIGAPNLIVDPKTASIIFDKVKFEYSSGRELFTDLSFEVPAGKKIAIVGGSGIFINIIKILNIIIIIIVMICIIRIWKKYYR
jgi:ABC-type transport system involved in Fe-S cluster assembly fused permease/ATPase subunit